MIEDYEGVHAGEDIAVLANGESLREVQWDRLSMPKIGVNKAWTEVIPEYHCTVHCADDMEGAPVLPVVFTGDAAIGWPHVEVKAGKVERLKALGTDGVVGWSDDLSKGAYFRGVVYLALQVAVYMVQRDARIFLFGLDWKGKHHYSDRPMLEGLAGFQRGPFERAKREAEARGIQIFNCNPDSDCDVFEKREVDAGAGFA